VVALMVEVGVVVSPAVLLVVDAWRQLRRVPDPVQQQSSSLVDETQSWLDSQW
jgi:hypothetical protein